MCRNLDKCARMQNHICLVFDQILHLHHPPTSKLKTNKQSDVTRRDINFLVCCLAWAVMLLNNGANALDAIAPSHEAGALKVSPPDLPTSAQNSAKPPRLGNPLRLISLEELPNTRQRPIFSPSRRPSLRSNANPPPLVQAPALPPPKLEDRPQLSLIGAVVSEWDGIAIFMEQATKEIVRLRMGEAHKGWTLVSLYRRQATLEKDGGSVALVLPSSEAEKDDGSSRPSALVPSPPVTKQTSGVQRPSS